MQRFITGTSEAVEAEFSYRAREAFTVLELYDNEPVTTEGFDTLASMLACETIQQVRAALKEGSTEVTLEHLR
jgi:hypothetical protein